jgi:membrane-associated PAP2 superfamily phosphatase
LSEGDHHATGDWLPDRSPVLITDPIVQILVGILLVSVFFLAFPGVDLWFSGLFHDSATGFFPMSRLGAFTGLRAFGEMLVWLTVLALLGSLLIKLALPGSRSLIPPRAVLFLVSTLAVGPGLIVNVIFKNNWGRPRPVSVEAFGGEAPFVGVWQFSDYCSRNCSFVSGEASVAIWLLAVAIVLPLPWRRWAIRAALVLVILLSFNRVAFGGHFLSDVLLAWGMTLLVIAVAHRLIYGGVIPGLTDARMDDALTRAGEALRRPFAGSRG